MFKFINSERDLNKIRRIALDYGGCIMCGCIMLTLTKHNELGQSRYFFRRILIEWINTLFSVIPVERGMEARKCEIRNSFIRCTQYNMAAGPGFEFNIQELCSNSSTARFYLRDPVGSSYMEGYMLLGTVAR